MMLLMASLLLTRRTIPAIRLAGPTTSSVKRAAVMTCFLTSFICSPLHLMLILWLRLWFLANNTLTLDILAHAFVAPLSVGHDDSTTCMLALALVGGSNGIAAIVEDFNSVARFEVA